MSPWVDSFIFGAANSLHCACMCGPLALAFHGGAVATTAWHAGRVLAYAGLGAALGAAGGVLGSPGFGVPSASVAFVLAAGLVVLALLGERGALAVPGLGGPLQRLVASTRGWSPTWRAGALGVLTPLLPCGLLWAACGGASLAGSAAGGSGVMAGFALGSLPLLWLAQTRVGSLSRRFGPRAVRFVQRAAMLSAAALLVWRGVTTLHGGDCCH
jgi:sulfite exporter TauE/SafE